MLATATASTTTSPACDRVEPVFAFEPLTRETLPSKSGAGLAQTTAELRQAKPDRVAFRAQKRLPVRVILDGVRQGYNVGALFRLSDAFLCESLVICGRDDSRGARKLVQAAQGTHKWVPWQQRESAEDAVRAARADGWFIVALEQTSGAVALEQFAPRFRWAAWPTRSTSRPPRRSSCLSWRCFRPSADRGGKECIWYRRGAWRTPKGLLPAFL